MYLVWKGCLFLLNKGMYQPGLGFYFGLTEKLDGVGPVDKRPSTDSLHHFVEFFLRHKKIKKKINKKIKICDM